MVRGVLYYSTLPPEAGEDPSRAGITLALACIDALGDGAQAARADALVFPPRGKPWMPGAPQFSVSHSVPIVACAAVSHGEVGLDVECDAAADRLFHAPGAHVRDRERRAAGSRPLGSRGSCGAHLRRERRPIAPQPLEALRISRDPRAGHFFGSGLAASLGGVAYSGAPFTLG